MLKNHETSVCLHNDVPSCYHGNNIGADEMSLNAIMGTMLVNAIMETMLRQVKCAWTHSETSFAAAILLDRLAKVFSDRTSCLVSYDVPADEKACKLPIWLKPDWIWATWISTLFWKQLQKKTKTSSALNSFKFNAKNFAWSERSMKSKKGTLIWCRHNFWLV